MPDGAPAPSDREVAPPPSPGAGAPSRPALVWSLLPYLVSVVLAFVAGGLIILALGHDPFRALESVLTTSFSTRFGLIETLHKWVPVALCALAFTIPLATGKFNIGAEGQLLVGATGAVAVGITFSDLPMIVLLPCVIIAGALAGMVWSGVAAFLLVRFKVNEILSTVLLNFVSFQVIDYVATRVWPDKGAGHPATTPIGADARMPDLGSAPSLHSGVLLAVVVSALVAVAMRRTAWGFEMTAVGANTRASLVHGVRTTRIAGMGLLVGGGVAGVAGAIEVAAVHDKMLAGMQSNFLILGIIVGLMARGNVLAVPFVAFGIAVLEVGARSMQRTAQVPVEVVLIIEALILLFLLLSDVVAKRVRSG